MPGTDTVYADSTRRTPSPDSVPELRCNVRYVGGAAGGGGRVRRPPCPRTQVKRRDMWRHGCETERQRERKMKSIDGEQACARGRRR
eukprot:3725815-Rhodomonas_salina.1